jgi:hypothetical protein
MTGMTISLLVVILMNAMEGVANGKDEEGNERKAKH